VYILLLGPQGSGKGTQAQKIAGTYGLAHIATGDMIRQMKDHPDDLGRELTAVYDRGDLVDDELMIRLIRSRLDRGDTYPGFVLDGFPRTMVQAEALDDLLRDLGRSVDIVFEFQIPDRQQLLDRMLKRAAVENRPDDTPEAILRRLELYDRETAPLVEYYRAQNSMREVNGDEPADRVTAKILDTLQNRQSKNRI